MILKNLTLDIIKKEVIFLVSCISNDKKIIMELEAGSRRSHWEREVYETGWLLVKSGSIRDTLERCSYSSLP